MFLVFFSILSFIHLDQLIQLKYYLLYFANQSTRFNFSYLMNIQSLILLHSQMCRVLSHFNFTCIKNMCVLSKSNTTYMTQSSLLIQQFIETQLNISQTSICSYMCGNCDSRKPHPRKDKAKWILLSIFIEILKIIYSVI